MSRKADGHFETSDLTAQLKAVTARGMSATVVAQAVKFILNLVGVVILSRLLKPSDFGLVLMVTLFIGVFQAVQDGGLSAATVQRPIVTHEQVSNLFWINLALGTTLAVIFAVSAPLIAALYRQPQLVAICIALSFTFLFSSPAVQSVALMQRRMRFRELMVIDVVSQGAGIVSAIVVALQGFAYWALVALPLVSALVRSAAVIGICSWLPGPPRRSTGVGSMLHFGLRVTLGNVVGLLSTTTTPLLIGYFGGPSALGLFNRASTLASLPTTQLLSPLMGPAQSAFARIAGDPQRFRRAALSLIRKICAASMILTVLLVVCADAIVHMFLGPGWDGAVPIVQLLALFALVEPMAGIVATLLVAVGKADRLLKWKMFSFVIILGATLLGAKWGVIGIVFAFALSGVIVRFPLFLIYAASSIHVTSGEIWRTCAPIILYALMAGWLLHVFRERVLLPEETAYLVGAALFALSIYMACLLVFCGMKADLMETLRALRIKKGTQA